MIMDIFNIIAFLHNVDNLLLDYKSHLSLHSAVTDLLASTAFR